VVRATGAAALSAGFLAFQAATLSAWLLVMRRILRLADAAWWIPVLAYPAVFWTIGLGRTRS